MMNLTSYEKYKDSGVEWLHEIPEDWAAKRVKDVFVQVSDKGSILEKDTYIPLENIEPFSGKLLRTATNDDNEETFLFKKGDILFNKLRPYLAKVLLAQFCGGVSSEAIVMRMKNLSRKGNSNKFYLYRFLSDSFIRKVNSITDGVKMPRTNPNKIFSLDIGIPPFHVQERIVNYLDCKTSQVDKKIELLQAKKEKYQELRKTLISEAVTKGLDKGIELKDSGVEWLGKIPHHWEVKRVKDLFSLITDIAPNNNDYQLLSIYTSIGVKPRAELEQRGNKAVTTDGYWIVRRGDFIVNKLLAWMGAIALSDYEGVTSPAYDILRKKIPLIQKYYEYLFRTEAAQAEFKRNSRGIMEMRLRLYFDKFGAISVPVQSLKEQQQIADYLNEKTQKIDAIIAKIDENILALNEFRRTLINDAVTGKINVV